ncbi:MAG: hypothetical protein CMJ18_13345 [Phycisphaeraceae bacterium]|nr:hypothetical protein [Phycisphaeraceae bacterium]
MSRADDEPLRTHVILDGLQDPALARSLSARWSEQGYANAVDLAGQHGWLQLPPDDAAESAMDEARHAARGFGVELHDRAGATFRPDNDLGALRRRLAYEYKSRLATALVFGLPAVALHYGAPFLVGSDGGRAATIFPRLIGLLLVGWACVAAGWPVLWQGLLSVAHLRASADLLTTTIILVSWSSSLAEVVASLFGAEPLGGDGPAPSALGANVAVTLAMLQRWLAHRFADRLSGRAMLMIPGFSRIVGAWIVITLGLCALVGLDAGIAVGLVFPPLIGLGAINRTCPGSSAALPVFAFALLLMIGPRAMDLPVEAVRLEIATGFALIMTAVMALGWRGMRSVDVPSTSS